MKYARLAALLGIVAISLAAIPTQSHAVSHGSLPIWTEVPMRTYAANVNANGYVDSTSYTGGITLNADASGGAATLDTSVWVDIRNLNYDPAGEAANTTAYSVGRFKIFSPNAPVTTWDTLYVALDRSEDGINVNTQGAFSKCVFPTAGDKGTDYSFLVDADAMNTGDNSGTALGGGFLDRYIRIRIRPDGTATSKWAGVRVLFAHFEYNK